MALIQIRRGSSTVAADNNPILADGEPGWEQDTRILKIGDGVTPWVNLLAISGEGGTGVVSETGHEGFTFRVGSGPLPDPTTVPDMLYLLVPSVVDPS